jgi:hypothetical protein
MKFGRYERQLSPNSRKDIVNAKIEIQIQEIRIAYGTGSAVTGKMFAATPIGKKPDTMPAETWAIALAKAASKKQNYLLAVPTSFWPTGASKSDVDTALVGIQWVSVMDQIDKIANANGQTPARSLLQVVKALKEGHDVLLLSSSDEISGFVPAIISKVLHPTAHVEKIVYPIVEGMGYPMTQFQLGYLYGMANANALTGQ